MKTLASYIRTVTLLVLTTGCISSCDYLDIVPPEQAALPDATKDAETTLGFLASCYAGICSPYDYSTVEAGADEWVLPPLWNESAQKITWGTNTPANLADGWRWGHIYRFIGQCHLFLQELPKARGVTDTQKAQWTEEAKFLIAFYHMEILRLYGPCAINDHYIDQNTPESAFPGRSHFDYVVEWICNRFDEVCNSGYLPETRTGDEWGRATTVMAKALKARLLLYAASPLWNGNFPFKEWKNTNYETPGYGLELVSHTYDRKKWEKALAACQEALQAAKNAGFKLFDLENSETLRNNANLPLPYVPLRNANDPVTGNEDAEFMKRVILMRYVVTTRYKEGNRETIWGLAAQGSYIIGSLPHRVIKNNHGTWKSGYSGMCPILNAVERFYTQNGELPSMDANFYPATEWFQRAGATGNRLRQDIIKLNTRREPRFYAWIAFDGGDMGSRVCGGSPLTMDLKNSQMHGYNTGLFNRDNCVTGYLNQKFIQPTFAWTASAEESESKPRPLIRMAELYLNLAECHAALEQNEGVLQALNPIRTRAGIRELTAADFSKMPAMDWVRNERSVELWAEGHRYYDVRRWMIAPETLRNNIRRGLNAQLVDPSFEDFNTPIVIKQSFKWLDRMYLLPLFANEVYKNPQFVQAPGY